MNISDNLMYVLCWAIIGASAVGMTTVIMVGKVLKTHSSSISKWLNKHITD